ncbi:MAG TPA: L,D-transpeptidase family protein [Solirubrobacteraceae bacterium]|jgi:peptidoglycan hydrolase-like protein with peptidoglycan-binding domain
MVRKLTTVLTVAFVGCATLCSDTALALEGEPPSAAPMSPTATVPATGRLKLTVEGAHGSPRFAAIGERIAIAGGVRPYVAGQGVVVSIYRNGRRVLGRRLSVAPASGGTGRFRISYASPHSGLLTIRAEHPATPQLAKLEAKAVSVRYEPSTLGVGSRGRVVRLLQDELAHLRYQVSVSGYYDEATGRAVVAFRKVAGQQRVESVNARIFQLLQRGAGGFHVRYPGDGNHVEADLSKQVLAEIERGGRVRRIITISSGKPSTPTVIGRFHVYSKEPGTNSHGMVDSSYFIGGYAIHGYAEVPTYAASHGCLRIPIPDAASVYAWVQYGYAVDVYTDSGRGSRTVRGNAGP